MQRGHDDLERGALLDRMLVDRDAAPVILDPDPAVGEQPNLDTGGITCQHLVNGVVHHLVDQVMKPAFTGRADVHAGTLTDGLKALENRDRPRIVRQMKLRPAFGSEPAPRTTCTASQAGITLRPRGAELPRPTGSLVRVTTFYFTCGYALSRLA